MIGIQSLLIWLEKHQEHVELISTGWSRTKKCPPSILQTMGRKIYKLGFLSQGSRTLGGRGRSNTTSYAFAMKEYPGEHFLSFLQGRRTTVRGNIRQHARNSACPRILPKT